MNLFVLMYDENVDTLMRKFENYSFYCCLQVIQYTVKFNTVEGTKVWQSWCHVVVLPSPPALALVFVFSSTPQWVH